MCHGRSMVKASCLHGDKSVLSYLVSGCMYGVQHEKGKLMHHILKDAFEAMDLDDIFVIETKDVVVLVAQTDNEDHPYVTYMMPRTSRVECITDRQDNDPVTCVTAQYGTRSVEDAMRTASEWAMRNA